MTIATSYENVTYNSPDGAMIGASASELIGFHGKTPCDQAAFVATLSTTVPTQTSPFGFSTSAQAIALTAAVNSILECLREKGLMASS